MILREWITDGWTIKIHLFESGLTEKRYHVQTQCGAQGFWPMVGPLEHHNAMYTLRACPTAQVKLQEAISIAETLEELVT